MDQINYWASKNLFISIFTILHKDRIEWSVGIRIGLDNKNTWLSSKDEGCQFSSFLSYDSALDHAVDFCKNYKPKSAKRISK